MRIAELIRKERLWEALLYKSTLGYSSGRINNSDTIKGLNDNNSHGCGGAFRGEREESSVLMLKY